MRDQVNEMGSSKVQLILEVEFIHHADDDISIKYQKSDPITVLHGSNMREMIINDAYNTLNQPVENISNSLEDSDYLLLVYIV